MSCVFVTVYKVMLVGVYQTVLVSSFYIQFRKSTPCDDLCSCIKR